MQSKENLAKGSKFISLETLQQKTHKNYKWPQLKYLAEML